MKVSFDFDSTLNQGWVQEICIQFKLSGKSEVFITTSRRPQDCSDVYEITDNLGIPRENCRFTTFEDKYKFLEDFDIHFDDDPYEIDLINRHTQCKGILIYYKDRHAF